MKKIFLATSNNASISKFLEFPEAIIEEIPDFPESIPKTVQSISLADSLLICEINNYTVNGVISFFQQHSHISFNHFCMYPEFDGSLRLQLIESGLCNIIITSDSQLASRCLRTIDDSIKQPFRGTVHIMSNASPFLRLLGRVVRRFHYDVKNAYSTDELIELSETQTPDLFLVDMDTCGFDSIEFAKKTSAGISIKKAPLILYKDMRNGLFVHDFNPTLQRLAKVILSREELLNFLLTLLFLSEISSPANAVTSFLQKTDIAGGKRFREIFYASGPDLCYVGNFFSGESFATLAKAGERINDLIERIEPLRWMISPLKKNPTCAGGV